MIERGVSALPVLDHQGRVTGVVSETDLLRKEEYQEDPEAKRPPRWRHHDAKVRAVGVTAGDVMTSPPVTITPDASIVAAARALDRHHVRRLVVISADGWPAGIVTPSDLLRVYLRSDEEIRTEILQQVIAGDLGTNPDLVKVAAATEWSRWPGGSRPRTWLPRPSACLAPWMAWSTSSSSSTTPTTTSACHPRGDRAESPGRRESEDAQGRGTLEPAIVTRHCMEKGGGEGVRA
jgi:predicted transcriptional regulator